jgi:hypothetical protein
MVTVVDGPTGTVQMYVNGVLRGTFAITVGSNPILTGAEHWVTLGNYPTAAGGTLTYGFTGKMTEVTFYNKALSPCRILAQYDAGSSTTLTQPDCSG